MGLPLPESEDRFVIIESCTVTDDDHAQTLMCLEP
jgi:hypothetical protein